MYAHHFALREAPFSITPDSAYFYPHESAQAAFNMLLVALRSGEGFLKVVGEVGCGKTVLCRQLLKTLQGECVTAYIPNPDMGPDDLLMALVLELGIVVPMPWSRHQVLKALTAFLLEQAALGQRVVVFIDEAQAIPVRTLESLRLLSNMETEKQKLLQLVLLGQPELDLKLAQPDIRQLLQRVTFSEYLGPMAAHRVPGYLRHRLSTASLSPYTNLQLFEEDAAQSIAFYSAGVPRLVNMLGHKCLMLAYGENVHCVSERHVCLAAQDTPGVRVPESLWTLFKGCFSGQDAGRRPKHTALVGHRLGDPA